MIVDFRASERRRLERGAVSPPPRSSRARAATTFNAFERVNL